MLIHTSPPLVDVPRHALVVSAALSRPGSPENAYSSPCMLSIVHKKCEHAMPDDVVASGLLSSSWVIGSSPEPSHVGLERKRIA